MPDAQKYSDDDVRQILERALQKGDGSATALTHSELLAIGEQVGVAPEAMARAAEDVARAKLDTAASRSIRSRRRKWLALHAAVFAIVNGLLFTVNALTTPGEWWFLFSVFFWGLALVAHAGVALGFGVSAPTLERERRKLQARSASATPRLRIDATKPAPAEVAENDVVETEASRQTSRS